MSENLDLVRSILTAWGHGEFSATDWAHPEIEWGFIGGPEPGTSKGLSGMAKAHREWLGAWENLRIEVEQYRELDEERVLVLVHLMGRGKTSGLEIGQVQAEGADLFHVRGDKVTSLVLYMNRDHALADLGLEDG